MLWLHLDSSSAWVPQVSGLKGARKIAALLEARGVQLSFLLDEGSAVLDGIVAGVKKPVAV